MDFGPDGLDKLLTWKWFLVVVAVIVVLYLLGVRL